jgi:hypothetical protein
MTHNGHNRGWLAEDMRDTSKWIHHLSEGEIADIDHALRVAQREGATCASLNREQFPIGSFRKVIDKTLEAIEDGTGLQVVRGLPASRYSKDEMRLIYWGIGIHMGTPVSQSHKGDILGDVRDFGADAWTATGRGYMSNQHLGFHSDSADVVALMVLRTAKSGGLSRICSSVAIAEEIARVRPDLYETLSQPFYWTWKGQEAPGSLPYYLQPVFSEYEGYFSSRFILPHIIGAQSFQDVPRLTDQQKEALEFLDRMTQDPRFYLEMMFDAGDIQFLNNHITYHSRTSFEDYEEEDRRRHLLRMWLSVPNSRPLSPLMAEFYRDVRPGAVRGGFPSRTGKHVYETRELVTD